MRAVLGASRPIKTLPRFSRWTPLEYWSGRSLTPLHLQPYWSPLHWSPVLDYPVEWSNTPSIVKSGSHGTSISTPPCRSKYRQLFLQYGHTHLLRLQQSSQEARDRHHALRDLHLHTTSISLSIAAKETRAASKIKIRSVLHISLHPLIARVD
jgi:hypothetical protein